jgi:hypothetical protein
MSYAGADVGFELEEIPETIEDIVYKVLLHHPKLELVYVYVDVDDAMVIKTGTGLTYIIQGFPKDEVEWWAGELVLEIMRDRPPFSAPGYIPPPSIWST